MYDLKRQGKVEAIGVGVKDWKMIQRILGDVKLDWVMIANSMTIKSHPQELLHIMLELDNNGVTIINSAVFHSGFLVGSDYFDYKKVSRDTQVDKLQGVHDFYLVFKGGGGELFNFD